MTELPEEAAAASARRPPVLAALVLAGLAAAWGLGTMHRYGVTIDSPSLFYSGDRTLFWLQHRDVPDALNFRGPEPPGFHTRFERHPEETDPWHYPVMTGLLAAVTSRLFHDRLGWVDVIDGHQMALVLLHALALFLYALYASRLLGNVAGLAATVALALFPCALGHSFNNAKDWPCAQFYGLAVLAAGVGIVEGRARHLLASALFVGLALSAKLNGIFVLPTVLLWTPNAWLLLYYRRRPVTTPLVGAYLLAPYVAGGTFFALWPWLYYGRLPDWWRHIHWYVVFMVDYGVGDRPTWTAHPFECLALMTPPLVLLLALLYFLFGWRGGRERLAVHSLLFIWLALPLLRIAAPYSRFYDANRHFIEYVPALCAMAGGGVALLTRWLGERLPRRALRPALGAGAVLGLGALVWPIAEYHPYETTYFNAFEGGLGRAQRRGLFLTRPFADRLNGTEGDYWYSSLRDGLRDLDSFSPGGATVGLCGPHPPLGRANLPEDSRLRFLDGYDATERADLVYASPRPRHCGWNDVRDIEVARPLLRRVERGGGLIYEVFGPRDGQKRRFYTAATAYDFEPGQERDERVAGPLPAGAGAPSPPAPVKAPRPPE
jgi:hypothetical protein